MMRYRVIMTFHLPLDFCSFEGGPLYAGGWDQEPSAQRIMSNLRLSWRTSVRRKAMKKILIVDDDDDFLAMMIDILDDDGFITKGVSDGIAAVREFESFRPDAVIIDHRMPGMTGLALLIQLKQLKPALPIIMVTATPSQELEREATAHGVTAIMVKPARITELITTVREAVRKG